MELNGLKKGGNRKIKYMENKLTQQEIAQELGISERELRNLLSIENNLIPEQN